MVNTLLMRLTLLQGSASLGEHVFHALEIRSGVIVEVGRYPRREYLKGLAVDRDGLFEVLGARFPLPKSRQRCGKVVLGHGPF